MIERIKDQSLKTKSEGILKVLQCVFNMEHGLQEFMSIKDSIL